jgi:hypothetical protein
MCIYLCETPKTRVCIRSWPSSYLRHICFRVFFSHRTTIRTYIKNAFLCTMDLVLFHNNIGFCRLSRSTSPHKVYRYVDWLTDSFSIRSQFVSINFTRKRKSIFDVLCPILYLDATSACCLRCIASNYYDVLR